LKLALLVALSTLVAMMAKFLNNTVMRDLTVGLLMSEVNFGGFGGATRISSGHVPVQIFLTQASPLS
jgi:hypothetical protein